jgi:hypothetical protein
VLFNAFLIEKSATMTMRGGNTDALYAHDADRREFAESLARQHPDVVRVVRRYGRWHHDVDYRPFRGNALVPRADVPLPDDGPLPRADEFGMELVTLPDAVPRGSCRWWQAGRKK